MFTSNYNPLQLIFMMTKNPAMDFSYLCTISFYVSVPFPPTPSPLITSFHLHLFFLAKLQTMLSVDKIHKCKSYSYPLGPKQVLNTFLQRISTRSAFAEKKVLCQIFPYDYPGGLDATDALDN